MRLHADIPTLDARIEIDHERTSLGDWFPVWIAGLREEGYREVPPTEFFHSLAKMSLEVALETLDWKDRNAAALAGWSLQELGSLLVFRLSTGSDVPTNEREKFRLPSPAVGGSEEVLLQLARAVRYQLVDVAQFERGSWPEVLCRELPELLLNRTPAVSLAASQSIGDLFRQRKIGPLGCLVAASILDEMLPGLARGFASFPQGVDFADAWADLRALAPPGSPGEEALLFLGRSWRGLHEAARRGDEGLEGDAAQAALSLFSTVEERDLAYVRVGLASLWAAGLDAMVREALIEFR